jgi:hypothetical protein
LAERLRRQRSGRGCQFARYDEHVIYEIAEDNGAAGKLKIEGYKIVNSAKQWMGTLLLQLPKRGPRTHLRTKRRASPVTGPSKLRTVR